MQLNESVWPWPWTGSVIFTGPADYKYVNLIILSYQQIDSGAAFTLMYLFLELV